MDDIAAWSDWFQTTSQQAVNDLLTLVRSFMPSMLLLVSVVVGVTIVIALFRFIANKI